MVFLVIKHKIYSDQVTGYTWYDFRFSISSVNNVICLFAVTNGINLFEMCV